MFDNSIACTISASSEGHWRLAEFCEGAGFKRITAYQNIHILSQQAGTLLPFCVIDDTTPVQKIKEAVLDIRSHIEIDVAFMPIMLLSGNTHETFVGQCIGLGFDDILKLPCRAAEFVHRAKKQYGHNYEYFKTDTYFGPDRRRSKATIDGPERRNASGFAFEKYLIRRQPRSGVKIISHEKFAADDIMAAFA